MAENMNYGNDHIDTTSLLLARGFGGYGGGYGLAGGYGGYGSGYLTSEAHANGTAVKEAIDCSIRQFDAGLNRVSDQAEESRRSAQFTTLSDGQFRAELRGTDRQRDMEQLIIAGQKEAAQCCCDAKLEACKNTAEIKALILSENAKTRELMTQTALDAANAKIIQLETINALTPNHPHRP